jgi:hypothetical protein
MQQDRDSGSSNPKPSEQPEQAPPPDSESTQGGQSGREIIPDAAGGDDSASG